ncbi:MAG: M56 family metallopeptidase [Niabella sp.]
MEWFPYLIKVSICTVIFFGFYQLLLRRLTFFKFNRFYLLITLLLSFVIPALRLTIEKTTETIVSTAPAATVRGNQAAMPLPVKTVMGAAQGAAVQKHIDWIKLSEYLYIAVALIITCLAVWRLFQLSRLISRNSENVNGLKLISQTTGLTNCSFFNYVFIDKSSLTEPEIQIILAHETVHAQQYHSLDKIALLFIKAVLWFNPVVYFYNRALEQMHEYEADEVTSQNVGIPLYANLILNIAISKNTPLLHSFSKSPVKERIKMLFNQKSGNMKKISYLLALPVCFSLFGLFGVHFVYAQEKVTEKKEPPRTPAIVVKQKAEEPQIKNLLIKEDTTGRKKSTLPVSKAIIVKSDSLVKSDSIFYIMPQNLVLAEKKEERWGLGESNGCIVTNIENDEAYTVVNFTYTAQHDKDWALLNKEIYIQANNDMKHFKYVKSEGIPMKPYKHFFTKAGETIHFKVYFEKIPSTAKSIDIIERAGQSNYFNFYNVPLPTM